MKRFLRAFLALFLALFLNSCASKNENFASQSTSQSVLVLISTKDLKINDAGFLKQKKGEMSLEIYKFAKPFFELKISDKICLNSICYNQKDFNKKFLKNAYYEGFLEDILRARPLYNAKNLEKKNCGFLQKLKSSFYEISYEVCGDKTSFFDASSGTQIILRKINGI